MIPVTVVGGYLGAGKTTLLGALLRASAGIRWAVLVNDFGSVNLDAAALNAAGARAIELTNGCTCCTIGADLVRTLDALARRDVPPERVIIEASGVADPGGVARLATAHPAFGLGAVAVVADATSIRQRAEDPFVGDLVRRQLAAASLVVVSKTDLAAPHELAPLRQWIATSAPAAAIVESVAGTGAAAILTGGVELAGRSGAAGATEDHASVFVTASCTSDDPLRREDFERAAAALARCAVRAKGFVRFAGATPGWYDFQLAGDRWSLAPLEAQPNAALRTEIVAIAVAPLEREMHDALALVTT